MSTVGRGGELLKPVQLLIEPLYGSIARIDSWSRVGNEGTGEFEIHHDFNSGSLRFRDLGENALSRSTTIDYRYGFAEGDFSFHDYDRLQMVLSDRVVEMLSRREGGNRVGYNFTWDEEGVLTVLGLDFGDYKTVTYQKNPESPEIPSWIIRTGRIPPEFSILKKLPPYLTDASNVLGMPTPWKNTDATPPQIFRRANLEGLAAALASGK